MVLINKQQREFLEEIGILKTSNKKWYYSGMTVSNINAKSKCKSYYVMDNLIAYIDADWFRQISMKYHGKEYVESQIKHAKLYLKEYEKRIVRDNSK